MAPSHSRQILVWTALPIAVLLSYLWFKRKRPEVQSDPGGIPQKTDKSLEQEIKEVAAAEKVVAEIIPSTKNISRSLSGIDTAPIDIILPPELKSAKSSQVIISDEDLDFEIEKVKSMKNLVSAKRQERGISSKTNKPVDKPKFEIGEPSSAGSCTPVEKQNNENCCKKHLTGCTETPSVSIPNKIKSPKTPMAQSDHKEPSVEENFSLLKLNNSQDECVPKKSKSKPVESVPQKAVVNHDDSNRQSCERDSANHSPADMVMMASPSLSSISDNQSEGSSDSGKGGSEVATSPSRTPAGSGSVSGDASLPMVYEFVIPQNLVGRLIGRHGAFVAQIRDKTRAHILIKKHPENNKLKICVVEGTQVEIDGALDLIREKFPEKRYPDVTLEHVSVFNNLCGISLIPDHLCLKLVEGINNDTIVSCMVSPNHLFLQQPTHPTFPNLNILSGYMNSCYSDTTTTPLLPDPIPDNTVCVAHSLGAWYRVTVVSTDAESESSYIRFLDYGGYGSTQNSELRQIRADFLMLPFQASECFLANIRPLGGETAAWSEDAYSLVAELTNGAINYTRVIDYTEEGIPLVLIYVAMAPQRVIFLNGELVNRGYAEWIPDLADTEGAVGGIAA